MNNYIEIKRSDLHGLLFVHNDSLPFVLSNLDIQVQQLKIVYSIMKGGENQ